MDVYMNRPGTVHLQLMFRIVLCTLYWERAICLNAQILDIGPEAVHLQLMLLEGAEANGSPPFDHPPVQVRQGSNAAL